MVLVHVPRRLVDCRALCHPVRALSQEPMELCSGVSKQVDMETPPASVFHGVVLLQGGAERMWPLLQCRVVMPTCPESSRSLFFTGRLTLPCAGASLRGSWHALILRCAGPRLAQSVRSEASVPGHGCFLSARELAATPQVSCELSTGGAPASQNPWIPVLLSSGSLLHGWRNLWAWLSELVAGSPCLPLSSQTETCLVSGSRFRRCLWWPP